MKPGLYFMLQLIKQLQFWALVLACVWLSLMPQPPGVFETASDKVWHLLAYLALFLSCSLAYAGRLQVLSRMILLFSFSLLIEVIQHFVPRREFSLADLAANGAGLMIGMLIAALLPRKPAD